MYDFVIFILGLIAGTLVAIGVDLFRRLYFRPKLEILDDRPEKGDVFSCHAVVVTNKGRGIAKNCHGMISFEDLGPLDLIPEDQIKKVKDLEVDIRKFAMDRDETYLMSQSNFRPIENEFLNWARIGNPLIIDIFPNTFHMLDVFRFIRVGEGQIHIPSENGWRSIRAAIRNRHYRIKIGVAAENSKFIEEKFIIEPSADAILLKKVK